MKKDIIADLPDERSEGMIEGRNAVTEALKSGRAINKVGNDGGKRWKSLFRDRPRAP